MNATDERHAYDQARATSAVRHVSQPEQHGALVLLEHPNGQRQADEHQGQQDHDHIAAPAEPVVARRPAALMPPRREDRAGRTWRRGSPR
jgi:hypothetical protein